MVETTPLGKWSGRRRTNLRLVLSSPRDKVNMKASVSLREGGAMLEAKVEKCAGIDIGKKFLAVCILIGLANRKPVAEVRRTRALELGAKDSADCGSVGRSSNERPSPLPDPTISSAYAMHRRDDRGLG